MTITDLFGYLGSLTLAISGTPQALKTFREGKAPGISWTFLVLLLVGFSSMTIFAATHSPPLYPLLVGYVVNFMAYSTILFFKARPRKEINHEH